MHWAVPWTASRISSATSVNFRSPSRPGTTSSSDSPSFSCRRMQKDNIRRIFRHVYYPNTGQVSASFCVYLSSKHGLVSHAAYVLESSSATAKLHRKSQQTVLESFGIKFHSYASIIKYRTIHWEVAGCRNAPFVSRLLLLRKVLQLFELFLVKLRRLRSTRKP